MKRKVLDIATRIGVDQKLLDVYRSKNGGYDFGDIDPKIREFELNPNEKKGEVLIPITQGFNRNAYCILAHAFRVRGYEPIIVLCYRDLPVCTYKGARYDEDDEAACAKCRHFGTSLLEEFGLDYVDITDVLSSDYTTPSVPDDEPLKDATYQGIEIGKYALASTRQFFMKRTIERSNEYQWDVFNRFIKSAMKIVDVAKLLFEKYDIDATVAFHDVYVYGGIYLAVSERNNIPAVSVSRGYRESTLIFGNQRNRISLPQFTRPQFVKKQLEHSLSRSESKRIREYMEKRISGEGRRIEMLENTSGGGPILSGEKNVGMFTNQIWDASLEAKEGLFSNPYDWIDYTFDFINENEFVEFIIKVHPAEAVRGTNESVYHWIHDQYSPLPDNVVLLEPDTDISPYEIIEDTDATLVYNSTVGLEAAYMGNPIIVAGDTHYRGFGFDYFPETIEEYNKLLKNPQQLSIQQSDKELAKRYAYFLFFRKHIPFPFYTSNAQGGVQRGSVNHSDIKKGNRYINEIIGKILHDKPVVV